MNVQRGDEICMTSKGKVQKPATIQGEVFEVATNSAMAGTYFIRLEGSREVYRSEEWDIEILDRFYPDGIYIVENNTETAERLTQYIVLKREGREWSVANCPDSGTYSRFLRAVEAGEHKMVRLVKEA